MGLALQKQPLQLLLLLHGSPSKSVAAAGRRRSCRRLCVARCPAAGRPPQVAIYCCTPGTTAEWLCEHAATRFGLQVMPTFQVGGGRWIGRGVGLCRRSARWASCQTMGWDGVGIACAETLQLTPAQRLLAPRRPQVVPLPSRDLLQPARYPRFTMLGQAAGSVRLAWQGLRQLVPEVWVDTTGWAAPYPLVRLAGARCAAYVHYPTISADMLQR